MQHHLEINCFRRLYNVKKSFEITIYSSLCIPHRCNLGSLSLKRVPQLRQDPASTLAAEPGRPPKSLFLWTPPIVERSLIHLDIIYRDRYCDTLGTSMLSCRRGHRLYMTLEAI